MSVPITDPLCQITRNRLSDTKNDYQKTCLKFGEHFIVIHIEIICAEIAASHDYFETVT